ncbi:MAG TPA: hypothetical protein VGJ26_12735 [Pirellulales bacterium]|jgi:HAMP domain-containing protein
MKRLRKILKWLAIWTGAIVAVLLLINALLNYRASVRLESKVTALRDAGQPVALADLAREAIMPDKNAVTYLRRAKTDTRAIQQEVEAAVSASAEEDQDRFHLGRLNPAIQSAIQAAFTAYPGAIGLLEQAAASADYDPQLDCTVDIDTFREAALESASAAREAMRVLNYRARLQIAEGKQAGALRTCIVMLRLCRQIDHEPLLTGYLMATACRGMAVSSANLALRGGPIPDELRDELDAELALHDSPVRYQNALISERASVLQGFRRIQEQLEVGPFGLPWLKNDAASFLDLVEEILAQRDPTYAAALSILESSEAVANAGTLTKLVVPSFKMTTDASCRIRAQLRALRILNALGRRADEAEPKLAELGLPAEATIDPFDGQPMRMKKLADGWLIYAVGPNLKDDGGKLNTDEREDSGLGPPSVAEAPRGPARIKPAQN